jgi:hypothetical protein
VRLLAGRLLGQAEADHVGDDDPVSGVHQRRDDVAVKETPGRIAVQQQDGIAGPFIDVVHPRAIDPRVAGGEGPFVPKSFDVFQNAFGHVLLLMP